MTQPLQIGVNHSDQTLPLNNSPLTERDEKGRFAAGNKLGKGRPPGKPNFTTEWFAFIERVAATNKKDPLDIEDQLRMVAFAQAQDGNFSFWKDIQDRVYGGALAKIEHSGEVTAVPAPSTPEVDAVVAEFNERLRAAIAAPLLKDDKQP